MTEQDNIILSKSIQFGDRTITQLTLREPVAGDLRYVKDIDDFFSACLDLGARLVNEPPSLVDKLSLTDAKTLIERVSPFLYGSRATG